MRRRRSTATTARRPGAGGDLPLPRGGRGGGGGGGANSGSSPTSPSSRTSCCCEPAHANKAIGFDRGLGQTLHGQLHWLDVPDRVLFELAVTVHQCLNGRAPLYLSKHSIPPTVIYLPYRVSGSTLIRPTGVLGCWPDGLELTTGFYPGSNEQHRLFRRLLKTYLFVHTSTSSALGALNDYALYKSTHSALRPWLVSLSIRRGVTTCCSPLSHFGYTPFSRCLFLAVADVTSSIKPEVHTAMPPTEDRATIIDDIHQNFMKVIGRVVLNSKLADRHTDKQTYKSQYSAPVLGLTSAMRDVAYDGGSRFAVCAEH